MNNPTFHLPVPMNTRVIVPDYYFKNKNIAGTVVGVSSIGVIFTYIVLLDQQIESEHGYVKAIVVHGPELVSEDGKTNWRIKE
jgi:hypothetical protein